MKYRFLLFSFLGLLAFACKNEPKTEAGAHAGHKANQSGANSTFKTYDDLDASGKALYGRVMTIHDSIMPQMSTIKRYQTMILPVFREQKGKQIQGDTMVNDMRNAMSNLNRAEDAMWEWMRDFDNSFDSIPKESKKAFLEVNLERIIHVQNIMAEGLSIGQRTAEKYQLSDAQK